jgi:hypothetical protein
VQAVLEKNEQSLKKVLTGETNKEYKIVFTNKQETLIFEN